MRKLTLLHSPDQAAFVRERLLPRLDTWAVRVIAYGHGLPEDLDPAVRVLCWLPDADIARLLPEAVERGLCVALLPHPEMPHARAGFGISARLDEALADALNPENGQPVDLLYCNDTLVLNSVQLGRTFTLSAPESGTGLGARVRRFLSFARSADEVRLAPFRIETRKGKVLDTAALGVVVVAHGRSSSLTRRALADSAANDGMLHALVLAPRSLIEFLRFLFASLFLRGVAERLPPFVGHLRTEAVRILRAQPIEFSVDGVGQSAREVSLEVRPRALNLVPGRHLSIDSTPPDAKESYRIGELPQGEVRTVLLGQPLPWIHHAETEEFRELFLVLKGNARASESFLTLMVLSTLLATVGLFANSAPVIIGAMILAPLMSPIISLAMGVLRQNEYLMSESARSLVLGIVLALGCATVLTWLTPLELVNSEIAARLRPTLLDLGVAVISGIAGAYAHARSEVARSLAGVAIAVALVPPLAVSGIGIGWGEAPVFYGAFLLFLTNLIGIVLAAALTFLWLGFSPFRLARRGLAITLILTGAVSVPLALGFWHMVEENRIVRTLESWESEGLRLRDVRIRPGEPLYLSVRLLSDVPLDSARIDSVKQDIETLLGRDVILEASVAVVR